MKRSAKPILAAILALILLFAFAGCTATDLSVSGASPSAVAPKPAVESTSAQASSSAERAFQFRKASMLEAHYQKHVLEQKEFGDITLEEYLKGAQSLLSSTDEDILRKTEKDGDSLFYRESTNEYAVLSTDGYIRTYFKPSRGIDYFNEQ